MNDEFKKHLSKSLTKGVRFDGRKKLDDWRKIEVETGFLTTAEGSARVKFGDTDVMAGVKLSVGTPFPDTPDEGVLMVNAEMLPMSNSSFESGPPKIDAIETSRVIDRGLRECRIMDTKALCIEAGEKVWMVAIDIIPINHDGNLLDAGALAALLALKNTVFPEYKDGIVDYEKKTNKKLPVNSDDPIPVTVLKVGENLLVDPVFSEEQALDARLTVTSSADGKLCAMQKGGDSPLTVDEINNIVGLALDKVKVLRKHMK